MDKRYFPQGEDEITFTMKGQRKSVTRPIDYFENIGKDNKTRILQYDCCNDISIEADLQIAAVQLKYNVYIENSVVKLTADESYYQKVIAILNALKAKQISLFSRNFLYPLTYLKECGSFPTKVALL